MSDVIIWTKTDEAPLFASYSLLPILRTFLGKVDINLQVKDISLAGRILANFSDILGLDICDDLEFLGQMTENKSANIIKLPNISATIPQLNLAISELQNKGFKLPEYPNEIKNEIDKNVIDRYAKVLGSAVNPVLRQGNSDRRCVKAVKEYARANPHSNGVWDESVKTRVAYMNSGDFYSNERSVICEKDDTFFINFISKDGINTTLKELKVLKDEIIDATFMSVNELNKFYKNAFESAKKDDLLVSLHLKATMMKVSDPVIFGHALRVFFAEAFDEFKDVFKELEVNENNGLKEIYAKVESLTDESLKTEIKTKFSEILSASAGLAMVNSTEGITNLHVPNDVIIDASLPAMLRNSGRMWDKDGELKQTLAIIPDKTYAKVYESVIANLKRKGALDPRNIGSVSNVGLMAKKAEEYGSHDKTFIANDDGEFVVLNGESREIFKFKVQKGDIFRMTQAKNDAIHAWISLALERAKLSHEPLIFWLDKKRAHDKNIIAKLEERLNEFADVSYEILDYAAACEKTLNLIREGKNVIGVTGNVLRDYLTDLFPILELGSSSKMLSVVPLLNGGAMFETGAGGTAPILARELIAKNHLAWDSLGEYLALIASLEFLGSKNGNKKAKILSTTLDSAVSEYLKQNRSPKAGVGSPDTRSSHFYLALYWSKALTQSEISDIFKDLAQNLAQNEDKILKELGLAQGVSVDFDGYFMPNDERAMKIMRPSVTLNEIIKG
ncbi:NADP-dependent isocitrate dehydrogenase [Campylobacter sp. faydin G-105]|uniref:NADP-dependent isocitrate dehydrogenase n=1 Tax=Campylobacter anatolicus TaxID=2829105 RepID=UPI001B9B534C|nr:NADP-dependent isocitrate dehydrogenase [Campylobacter anatolicus]MBR8462892.1 NADP-dependent isocitrate dehydrogenase [Campylobacter anatolicus]